MPVQRWAFPCAERHALFVCHRNNHLNYHIYDVDHVDHDDHDDEVRTKGIETRNYKGSH